MIALVEAYKAGRLKKEFWLSNLTAGLIVGIVALPLAMAFAIASGARPEQGLYTAIVAGFLVSVFGGSQLQIAGPTGAFIIILASITAKYGIFGLQIATLMAGFILVLMGAFRLGNLIKFIPEPVIIGFTAGIGVIIFVGQWKDFFGFHHLAPAAHFHEKIITLLKAFPQFHLPTTLLAFLGLFLLWVTPKLSKCVPAPLVAMLVVTLLQAVFHFENVATIGSTFGGIPQMAPSFQLPSFSWQECFSLVGPAFSIAILGAIESLLSALVADNMANTQHHSNQELIGQGIANIFAPLFGGFAATGAIARTATNIKNGGSSPLAGIIHSVTLLLIIMLLAPLAAYIPLCVLAAILFIVAYNMSEAHRFIHLLKVASWKEVIVLLTAFLLTVFTDLIMAVGVGIILSFSLKFVYVKQLDV